MRRCGSLLWVAVAVAGLGVVLAAEMTAAQTAAPMVTSRLAGAQADTGPESAEYRAVQARLAQGWNTWDVNSVTTHVLLPDGLAIHVGVKHNSTEGGDAFLGGALIGRLDKNAEQVTPGAHAWDGGYTDLQLEWRGHRMRIQSAHEEDDMVLLVTPLPSMQKSESALPPTVVFWVNFLWNRIGSAERHSDFIQADRFNGRTWIYCTCASPRSHAEDEAMNLPVGGAYFSADLTAPIGISTGRLRRMAEIQATIDRRKGAYEESHKSAGAEAPILDAMETTLGWDTIYEPEKKRVISPVSRVWSMGWGGYVIFDWDTFFAATMAGAVNKDLAYADAIETLREETPAGFVPNYARAGGWKSFDRSEPPVGAITVLGLYRKFHEKWFLEEAFEPLLRWNRWWAEHRDMEGYLTWGSDAENQPANLDDDSRGTHQGAVFESGLDNSPMYDAAVYNPKTHLLEFADVGLMSMYIADCDALAEMADALEKPAEAKELRGRAAGYKGKLGALWDEKTGIFLNKDLHTGELSHHLSPTNFYPMMAHAATAQQARTMIEKHLLNPEEFDGEWVIPSIARNDPGFKDQNYWRGRIWGPMNYLVYLGLENYDDAAVRSAFAEKSYRLFLKEWEENGHVHENYNALTGSGDDVTSSDRFYHWGALLGYVEYLEREAAKPAQ